MAGELITFPQTESFDLWRQSCNSLSSYVGAINLLSGSFTGTNVVACLLELKGNIQSIVAGTFTAIPNDQWYQELDSDGTAVNLFKVTTDDEAVFGTNFVPVTDSLYNLGSATKKFAEVHADTIGTAANYIEDIYVTNLHVSTLLGLPILSNNTYLQAARYGATPTPYLDILKANTTNSTVLNTLNNTYFAVADIYRWIVNANALMPYADNSYDLGNTEHKVNRIYANITSTSIVRYLDNLITHICSGSVVDDATKGPYIKMTGIDYGGTKAGGYLQIYGANNATSPANGTIDFILANASAALSIFNAGTKKVSWTGTDKDYTFYQNHAMKANNNTLVLSLCGGSAQTATNGASINLGGISSAIPGGIDLTLGSATGVETATLNIYHGTSLRWKIIGSSGELQPYVDNTTDIGDASHAVRAIYARQAPMLVPIGTVLEYASDTLPDGFLWADGHIYVTTQYPDLYAKIGNKFGGVAGSTFAVPDRRNKYAAGNSFPGVTDTSILGTTTGSATHTHDINHIHPLYPHTHGHEHTHALAEHFHSVDDHMHNLASHSHVLYPHLHDMGLHQHSMQGHTHGAQGNLRAQIGVHLGAPQTIRMTLIGDASSVFNPDYSWRATLPVGETNPGRTCPGVLDSDTTITDNPSTYITGNTAGPSTGLTGGPVDGAGNSHNNTSAAYFYNGGGGFEHDGNGYHPQSTQSSNTSTGLTQGLNSSCATQRGKLWSNSTAFTATGYTSSSTTDPGYRQGTTTAFTYTENSSLTATAEKSNLPPTVYMNYIIKY